MHQNLNFQNKTLQDRKFGPKMGDEIVYGQKSFIFRDKATFNWIPLISSYSTFLKYIYFKKEQFVKIPGKGDCKEIPIEKFLQCVTTTLVSSLRKIDIKCKIPALSYIDVNTTNLEYCDNADDALAVNGLVYKAAQIIQVCHIMYGR